MSAIEYGQIHSCRLCGLAVRTECHARRSSLAEWGEPIMKLVLGKWAADQVKEGHTPEIASSDAIKYLKARLNGHGGMILLDGNGRFGISHNTPRMAWAYKSIHKEDAGVTV